MAGSPVKTRGKGSSRNLLHFESNYFDDVKITLGVGPVAEGDYVSARWNFTGTYNGKTTGASAAASDTLTMGKEIVWKIIIYLCFASKLIPKHFLDWIVSTPSENSIGTSWIYGRRFISIMSQTKRRISHLWMNTIKNITRTEKKNSSNAALTFVRTIQ